MKKLLLLLLLIPNLVMGEGNSKKSIGWIYKGEVLHPYCFQKQWASSDNIQQYYEKFNEKEQLILNNFYRYFRIALSNIINIVDPDVIIIGGMSNHDELYGRGKREFYKNTFSNVPTTPIIKNILGDSAGVIGAAIIGI